MIRSESHSGAILVYGGGDHGRVVAEAAQALGLRVAGFLDDGPVAEAWNLPAPLLGSLDDVAKAPSAGQADADARPGVIVAVGDNATRAALLDRVEQVGFTLVSIVHPAARVSVSASIEAGVFIGPGAVVHTQARVARGAIINSGAVVEHDNIIGAGAHIGPGAALGGRVSIGEGALVGLNAAVLPGITVGQHATVGAGAVVTRPVEPGTCVCGCPARRM
ncbi:MAG: acetyltransferase [Phycisphaeraceae bacterium]